MACLLGPNLRRHEPQCLSGCAAYVKGKEMERKEGNLIRHFWGIDVVISGG